LPPKHQTSLNEKPFLVLALTTHVQWRLSVCTLRKPQRWCISTPNNNVKCLSITFLTYIEENGNVLTFCHKTFKSSVRWNKRITRLTNSALRRLFHPFLWLSWELHIYKWGHKFTYL
jgi:hypothetical protein